MTLLAPAGLWCATCLDRVDSPDGLCESCGSPALTSHHPTPCRDRWGGRVAHRDLKPANRDVKPDNIMIEPENPLVRRCVDCLEVKEHKPRTDSHRPASRCSECTSNYGKAYKERNWQRQKAKNTWKGMVGRCHDPEWGKGTKPGIPKYSDYGAKGVTVAKRWRGKDGFERFLKAVGLPPTRTHTLDRKNPKRNYTPSNVAWVCPETQRANRKNSRWIEAVCPLTGQVRTRTIGDWGRATGVSSNTIRKRLQRGWTEARAVTTPVPEEVPF